MVIILLLMFAALGARAENLTIAILGDSLVQGYGLPAEKGFVPQMQAWLDDRGTGVTLINAGVSGDTTAGGLARIDWTLAADVDALIVSLGGNDVLRGIEPSVARRNLDAILQISSDRRIPTMLIGIGAPKNFGAAYQQAFQSLYGDLAKKHQVPLYSNFLGILLDFSDRQLVLREYYQSDALHPNAKGVALIVDDMGPNIARFAKTIAR